MLFIIPKKRLLWLGTAFFLLVLSVSYAWAKHPQMEEWKRSHQVICEYDTADKVIALTFDDGPNPQATPQILETLKKYQAHATFFTLGSKLQEYPLIAEQILSGGHELGNHSWAHTDFNTLSHDDMLADIEKTNAIIEELTGTPCVWLRPPGGFLSVDLVENIIPALSMKIGYWSYIQDSRDWEHGRTADAIAEHIIRHIAPGQVILLHDGTSNSPETAKAVEMVLEQLTEEGYTFLTFSEMEARYGSKP